MPKTILVVGLGLIGGSMAMAISSKTDCHVLGYDIAPTVCAQALANGVVHQVADSAQFAQADIILIALYPTPAVEFMQAYMPFFRKGSVLIDLCGVKQYVVSHIAPLAAQYGVQYIGGHPMAGREFSGLSYAQADLYEGASMIFVPDNCTPAQTVTEMQAFFQTLGFAKTVCTTAIQHDDMIAFTSQLAHVVSSAYIKSPEALRHDGYSAGSYKDLTRVARLNEYMWSELFLHNQSSLVREIDEIIHHLRDYRDAIADGQEETLLRLLKEGRERKEQIG